MSFLTKIFGSRNQRLLKQYQKTVRDINALEPQLEALSDQALQAKTAEFKARVAAGASLDSLLPEAFAVCREASKRVLKMRHFDVQMIGGMVLHFGKIAEMGTGEGKTLMGTLPIYLNALSGEGVHVVTVNDYLAQRDAEWMGQLYSWLGLTTGINLSQLDHDAKQLAYGSDVTYGTNNEFGFDYLRDNMVFEAKDRVQRRLNFAVVDEVDSILIDEARTPLIISGQAENHTELYYKINEVPKLLTLQIGEETADGSGKVDVPGDYTKDEKAHQVLLTEAGHDKAERILTEMGLLPEGASLYDAANITLIHHLYAALRAHALYFKDQHYVVLDEEIVIVDEFTGRMMTGRRWSDGLHQAVEAKEGVRIQNENQTLASITFQNYFRMYTRLSGMTGTADTEAYEFQEIYGLETVVIPPNRPSRRLDRQDQVYKSAQEKYGAMLKDIQDCYERGQPVLVGTTSIENSELLSGILSEAKLPHNVLNAKQHQREAEIIAQAGRPQAITIATNMAGRGTDIVLGGNVAKQVQLIEANPALAAADKATQSQTLRDEWKSLNEHVVAAGGLHIIGTERHESRRVDNQLRGRSGRQGDPGSSRFYLSLDDQLLRIFAGDRVRAIMERLKMPEGEPIEAGIVSRSIESAQRKVEARNFDIRKQLLEYDDVANDQRKVIYQQRNELLEAHDMTELMTSLRHGMFADLVHAHVPPESVEEQWDVAGLENVLANEWAIDLPLTKMLADEASLSGEDILERVLAVVNEAYEAKLSLVGKESFAGFERSIMLTEIDSHWREHLAALDHLRQGIHLRGYAQKNPKQEYKREAFELFAQMLTMIKNQVVRTVVTVRIQSRAEIDAAELQLAQSQVENVHYQHADFDADATPEDMLAPQAFNGIEAPEGSYALKVGRNDVCPCGSGKKFKQCHGKLA
ncbi:MULTISPECIES: preprotein translocase subunit SecA [unclassified Undibacterium]|uniref:preprotein translocase subunit SecA n=2 Tax=Pseudomonadota TaxID=1224 RepID=UPI002AC98CDC|nr:MULTISPECIES: preprotein translocase subunit SecA [unclassified Undibacterium]MEB0138229.1 preprotein translocase subunit SecA [Undibacterium sp. CCC2.1]MEB0171610.1 preprotein translocase subunit SecA [Undibacterium sp. CCC1.1]MEB0175470.1 preprotein translocase subunit SecA [Undibacterium sp. CCC3.4]MEB0214810.1 preprotein translocase subunit SecA [Undibacterium sp. 5I2]WPX45296.1 preprotein translocase subunit SecA [Undibacterium sp. CCC3.4]